MNPDQYREALARLGLSVVGAGKLFGVNPRTSQRWAAGDQDIPTAVSLVIRYWIKTGIRPDELTD